MFFGLERDTVYLQVISSHEGSGRMNMLVGVQLAVICSLFVVCSINMNQNKAAVGYCPCKVAMCQYPKAGITEGFLHCCLVVFYAMNVLCFHQNL